MAGTTTNRAYPYPGSADVPNVHTDIQSLATSIDTDVTNNFAPKASPTFTGLVAIPSLDLGFTTTATAGGTTTLTVASTYNQYFTGTLNQTVVLPVTSTLSTGVRYEIANNSTGVITINSSGGNLVATVAAGGGTTITCVSTGLTTAVDWDADLPNFSGTVSIPAIDWGYTTVATAAGTTTLTVLSNYFQIFTGVTTQTVVMPVTSTLSTGHTYKINNNSTGNLTVNSSGANLIVTVLPNTTVTLTCIGTTLTTAADWDAEFDGFHTNTGTGNNVLATSPTLVTPALGTPSSGTLTSCTGLPIAGTTGWGTGVATLLAGTSSGTVGLVGSTSPTITTPTLSGTVTMSGAQFLTGGITYFYQPTVTTLATTGANTLTIAQLLTEIISYTGGAIATFTLPTGTLMDGGITGIVSNVAFDWSVVNTVAFAITMAAGTTHTYVGNVTVAANVSARFRSVRTAATTWITYRIA